jgi:hypothetical protein
MQEKTSQLLVTVSYETQVEVEEYCTNKGISISKYFDIMHSDFKHRQSLGEAPLNGETLPKEEKQETKKQRSKNNLN